MSFQGTVHDYEDDVLDAMFDRGVSQDKNSSVSQDKIDETRRQVAAVSGGSTRQPFDFGKSYEKYAERLKPFFSESPRPNFYDLASDLGAAMLSADPTAGVFRSAGIGFSNFNERLRKDKENRRLLDRQLGLQAFQMASADEKAARDFLNKAALEQIKNSQHPYDPLIYEIPNRDDPNGEPQIVEVNPRIPLEVQLIRSIPGARQITLPDSQTQLNIDSRTMTPSEFEKTEGKNLSATLKQWREDAKAGRDQNILTEQFIDAAKRLGPEGWGTLQARTLTARLILDELGIRTDENIADQALVDSLGTRISMSLIALTKGAITEMEMRLFQRASPSLASSYEGALQLAGLLQRIANLNIKKAEDFAAAQTTLLAGAENDAERANRVAQWEREWFAKKENKFLTAAETAQLKEKAAEEPIVARDFREGFLKNQDEIDTDLSRTGL